MNEIIERICAIARHTTTPLIYATLSRVKIHIHKLRHPSGYFYHTSRKKKGIHSLQIQPNMFQINTWNCHTVFPIKKHYLEYLKKKAGRLTLQLSNVSMSQKELYFRLFGFFFFLIQSLKNSSRKPHFEWLLFIFKGIGKFLKTYKALY